MEIIQIYSRIDLGTCPCVGHSGARFVGDGFDENISWNFGRGGGPAGNSLQGQITVSTGNVTVDFVLHKLVFSRSANSWDVCDRLSTGFKVKLFFIVLIVDFLHLGIFILGIGDFEKSGDVKPWDWGFSEIWFFIPGIGNFRKSWNFYLGNWEFLKIWGCKPRDRGCSEIWVFFSRGIGDIYPSGLGIFENMGIFIPGIFWGWRFFVGWQIQPKSHLWFFWGQNRVWKIFSK